MQEPPASDTQPGDQHQAPSDPLPLLIITCAALAAGISSSRFFPLAGNIFAIAATAFLSLTTLFCIKKNLRRAALVFLVALLALIGNLRAGPPPAPPNDPSHIHNLLDIADEATITGVLAEMPTSDGEDFRLLVETEEIRWPDGSRKTHGRLLLTAGFAPPPDLLPGDRLMARASLFAPSSFHNPGGFDYRLFLAEKGIHARGRINAPLLLAKAEHPSPPSPWHHLRFLPERLRSRMAAFIDATLPPPEIGLGRAILIGDRRLIPPEQNEEFNASGLTHLLAISGLHITILALFLYTLFYRLFCLWPRLLLHISARKWAVILSLPLLTGYSLIAGFGPPVIRSLLMTAIFALALAARRQPDMLASLLVAGILLIAAAPWSLFSPSFQLTFVAVLALILFLKRFSFLLGQDKKTPLFSLKRCGRWLFTALGASLAAMIGTAPLVLFHFNRVSLAGLFSTMVVTPFFCFWALPVMLAACLALPFSLTIATWLMLAAGWGITISADLAAWFAALPGASFYTATPGPLAIVAWYCFWLAMLALPAKAARHAAIASGLLLVAIPVAGNIQKKFNKDSAVTVLDIGQGSAVALELSGGKTFLIDGGGKETPHFNVGSTVIAPYLWRRGITRLDGVVISHAHADHYNGLPFIIKNFKPGKIWVNGEDNGDWAYRRLLDIAADSGSQVIKPARGDVLFDDGGNRITAITNFALEEEKTSRREPSANEDSLVIRLDSGSFSALFPADIGTSEEDRLIRDRAPIDVDLVLAPHHGSLRTSNSVEFFTTTSPSLVVISTTDRKSAVAAGLAARLVAAGLATVPILTTGQNGAVTVTIGNDGNQAAIPASLQHGLPASVRVQTAKASDP